MKTACSQSSGFAGQYGQYRLLQQNPLSFRLRCAYPLPAGYSHPEPACYIRHLPEADKAGAVFGRNYRWCSSTNTRRPKGNAANSSGIAL